MDRQHLVLSAARSQALSMPSSLARMADLGEPHPKSLQNSYRSSVAMQWTDTLVIGVASSALFDLHRIACRLRRARRRRVQVVSGGAVRRATCPWYCVPVHKEVAGLNDLATGPSPVVEVIVLSRNDPKLGLESCTQSRHTVFR